MASVHKMGEQSHAGRGSVGWTHLRTALLATLAFARVPRAADAHGMMVLPRTRNVVAAQDGKWWVPPGAPSTPRPESCPHCLNRGGSVGACGVVEVSRGAARAASPPRSRTHQADSASLHTYTATTTTTTHSHAHSHAHSPSASRSRGARVQDRNYNVPKDSDGAVMRPLPIEGEYVEGGLVTVRFTLTAHHRGHVELKLCPDSGDAIYNAQQECFEVCQRTRACKQIGYTFARHEPMRVRVCTCVPANALSGRVSGRLHAPERCKNKVGGEPVRR